MVVFFQKRSIMIVGVFYLINILFGYKPFNIENWEHVAVQPPTISQLSMGDYLWLPTFTQIDFQLVSIEEISRRQVR
jgi:hypothetical protein